MMAAPNCCRRIPRVVRLNDDLPPCRATVGNDAESSHRDDADSEQLGPTTEELLKPKTTTERTREKTHGFDFTCDSGIPTTQSCGSR